MGFGRTGEMVEGEGELLGSTICFSKLSVFMSICCFVYVRLFYSLLIGSVAYL